MYPVGSIYITVMSELPPSFTNSGMVWVKLNTGRCLWNTDAGGGGELPGILPNHTHVVPISKGFQGYDGSSTGNTFYKSGSDLSILTSNGSTSIANVKMGNDLRPPSIAVTMWKRTS